MSRRLHSGSTPYQEVKYQGGWQENNPSKLQTPHGYKYESFNPATCYKSRKAPEAEGSFNQHGLEELIRELELPEEIVGIIEGWLDEQIRLGMREFIFKLTNKMSRSLHGFCVLRALGYHAHLQSKDGTPITSLRAIAKHFKCSHQYVDKLSKDLADQLGVKIYNAQIEERPYSMKVTPPKGWVTIGHILKSYEITRGKLWSIIKKNKVEVREYYRNSKIVREDIITQLINQQ
jgi:hypothetical protein